MGRSTRIGLLVLSAAAAAAGGCGDERRSGGGGECGQPVDGSRLKAVYLAGEDGSRAYLPENWHDSELGGVCFFRRASDGVYRCLPTSAARVIGHYSDAGCTQPVGGRVERACEVRFRGATRHAVEVVRGDPTCGPDLERVLTLGQPVDPAILYRRADDGTCQPDDRDPAVSFYEVGAEVPASTFVAATGRTEGTRLQFEYRVAEDGASSLISSLEFDPRFQSVCDWSFAADGAVRCLPLRAGSAGNYFADPQCARPLVEEWTSGPSCPGQPELRPMVATRTTVEGQCLRRTHVFEIGAKSVPSTTYLDLGGGGCYPLPNTEAVPYYELGAEIPPARFAAASGPMTVACGHDRTSGTRLKARYSQADGGDRITQGFGLASVAPRWYDEAMGGECSFQNAEDGVMRCLPRVLGGDSFADPACSEPLIMADSCSPPDGPDAPRFAGEALFDQGGDLDVCVYNDVKVRVYALGAAVTPAEYYVRSSTDGACTAQPNIEVPPDVHPFTFYPRGAEVPPSAFVAASLHGP